MTPLSQQEKICLKWAAAGKTSFEVGTILSISPRTVDHHIYNACLKLGVHTRQAGVVMAMELGLFPNIRQLLPRLPNVKPDADQVPAHAKTQ